MGVLLMPNRSASSGSATFSPGFSAPAMMASRIVSRIFSRRVRCFSTCFFIGFLPGKCRVIVYSIQKMSRKSHSSPCIGRLFRNQNLPFQVSDSTLRGRGAAMDPVRHLKNSILVLFILVTLGTAGYMAIEGWRLLDALYLTVITLSTVGFREVYDLSDAGKVFTICLIIFGVSVLGYLVGSLAQIMFEGQFQRIIGRKKVEKMVEALKDHYIICGYGRMGSLICREFTAKPLPFVVVEKNTDIIEKLKEENYLFLHGD